MAAKKNSYVFNGLMILLAAVMVVPFLASCGKSDNTTPSSTNKPQLIVANLSPDLYPVDLWISNQKQNGTSAYRFASLSAYFGLNIVGERLQIRSDTATRSILYNLDSIPRTKGKYTLFITGLRTQRSDTAFLLTDTSTLAPVGRGKLRFVNASMPNTGLDVYANGTMIFSGIGFAKHTDFKELPAGNYDIKIYAKGDNITVLKEINPLTVGDSKLYTMYTYGILGRTDSAVFNSAVITNK